MESQNKYSTEQEANAEAIKDGEHLFSKVDEIETIDDIAYEQISKQVGEQYQGVIDNLIGKNAEALVLHTIDNQKIADFFRRAISSIETHRERQELLVDLRKMKARDFLRLAAEAKLPEGEVEDFLNKSTYRLEALSRGIYALYLDYKSFVRILSGTYATAVLNNKNVSFIMIQ